MFIDNSDSFTVFGKKVIGIISLMPGESQNPNEIKSFVPQ